ncbi:YbjQ family protein [Dongshaea marina]|uniref:YbjQ family protein n=1 Tax=Dongshaea marina TaxID=2047966 RepID=UPI000D3E92E8|nr:YbjQ family protein [Dongshaea marina]
MIPLSTTGEITGYRITQTLGVVTGNMVQSKHIGRNIMANLKNLVGGEIAGYTEMLTEARTKAQERMIQDAQAMGADGIVCVRFTTSAIAQGMSELLAYGTAVKITKA